MNEPIRFRDIEDFSKKHTTIVMLSLLVDDYPGTIEMMNETFKDVGLFIQGEVLELRHIEDNVLGDKGRSDFLIVCSDDTKISPIRRMQIQDIKWTEDFINNCRKDYLS